MKKLFYTKPFDYWIFVFTLMLVSLGIIMVFSASTPYAKMAFDNIYYFLNKQLIAAGIGLILMIGLSFIDYRLLKLIALLFIGLCFLLLIAVLIPGIGQIYNGARRWIDLGPGFQPSEFFKLALIIFLSYSISKNQEKVSTSIKWVLYHLTFLAIAAVLLLAEPHLSATIIISIITFLLLFIGGAKFHHLMICGFVGGAGLVGFAVLTDYTNDRLTIFLNPFKDPLDLGYQLIQSFYAIGAGGLLGRGLGKSVQKFLYMPEQHNDFIFSILAEELGFIGCLVVILLFFLLVYRGMRVSINTKDPFGKLLAGGISCLFFIQAILNIGVVTGALPTTGISLPFFSFGGTSLVVNMVEIGLLLSISRHAKRSVKKS
ncbi:MAG: putative lipid II flippase FtsW [Clostridiales bacterium]|nr:putative lipid II flippase FtsW [Clostridiales bacterium]